MTAIICDSCHEEIVHATLSNRQVIPMSVAEAAAKDSPEGTVTVTVSATLFRKLIDEYKLTLKKEK